MWFKWNLWPEAGLFVWRLPSVVFAEFKWYSQYRGRYDTALFRILLNFAHVLQYSHFVWSVIWAKPCPHQSKDRKTRVGRVSCRGGWRGTKKKRFKLRWWDIVSEVPSSEPFIDAGLPVCGARRHSDRVGPRVALSFCPKLTPALPPGLCAPHLACPSALVTGYL